MNTPCRRIQGPSISVIITTYNWPFALRSVLNAMLNQTTDHFEIIIADDGSGADTKTLIESMQAQSLIRIKHVWQEDQGFRASQIRNKAILAASHDYIVFLDGDCIPRTHFIENHQRLAEKGYFVVGNRILLTQAFTVRALAEMLPLHQWKIWHWIKATCLGHCNRFFCLFPLPLGKLRKIHPRQWKGAKGCNLGMWREDLITINGWDENFKGWGYEDSELVLRMIAAGIKRKEGRFRVPVLHLWHPSNDRSREAQNWNLLQLRKKERRITCQQGLKEHLSAG